MLCKFFFYSLLLKCVPFANVTFNRIETSYCRHAKSTKQPTRKNNINEENNNNNSEEHSASFTHCWSVNVEISKLNDKGRRSCWQVERWQIENLNYQQELLLVEEEEEEMVSFRSTRGRAFTSSIIWEQTIKWWVSLYERWLLYNCYRYPIVEVHKIVISWNKLIFYAFFFRFLHLFPSTTTELEF